jgi:hemoglobin
MVPMRSRPESDDSRETLADHGGQIRRNQNLHRMTKTFLTSLLALAVSAFAAEPAAPKTPAVAPACVVDGKPVKAGVTTMYEERSYSFCSDECKAAFVTKVNSSIYHRIGGKPAMDAAIEIFYKKVLADSRIKHFFEGVNMKSQARKQNAFLSAAFGSPVKWDGLDMRTAHADLTGLNDTHFNAVAEHLKATLEELKVKGELITQILSIAEGVRGDVLNKKQPAK